MDSSLEKGGYRRHDLSLEQRLELESRAFKRVLNQISQVKSVTPEEALQLLVKFASYNAEVQLVMVDQRENRKADDPDHFGFYNPIESGKSQMALSEARISGDYRKLKELFNPVYISGWTEIPNFTDNIKMLVGLVPDHGKPITYPLPAWMDELEYQQTHTEEQT